MITTPFSVEAVAALVLRIKRLEMEREALRNYATALERALANGRKSLDAQGRGVRKARMELKALQCAEVTE